MEAGVPVRQPSAILQLLCSLALGVGQHSQQHETRRQDADAHQVRRRGPAAEVMLVFGIIAAEHFHERARHGIAHQINREHLPVEFLAPIQPGQREVKTEVQERIVDLRGMNCCAVRIVVARKMDCPRQSGRR